MPASITTAGNILKEVYEGSLRDQINSKIKLLSRLEKTSTGIVGAKYVTFPIHTTRNSGVGARRENETLPSAGNQGTEAARLSLKYLYGRIQLSGPVIELVDSDFNTFISALELETDKIKDDLKVDLNRQCYGNSTGLLAVTSTVGSNVTATITSGIKNLQVGEVIDVYTAAAFAAEGAVKSTVTIISLTATTVTVSSAVTWANLDCIVRTGNINREITGIGAIVSDTGTLYNISPTTVPVWASTVDANGGTARALGESMMITMSDNIVEKGSEADVVFTSLGVRRAYFNLLEQQREFSNTSTFTGGFGGLKFMTDDGEIPIVSDKDCPSGTMYFLSTKHLKVYQPADWRWLDRQGSKWVQVPNTDAFSATLYRYMELGTDRRNAHGKIADITEG
jgi:hypothetical protein